MTSETANARGEMRDDTLEIAEAIAPGWERQRAFVEGVAAPVRDWLIRELDAPPGATVLELAAGAGDTGFEVAATLGDGGRLISSDFSPAMLDVARRRGRELGVEAVDYRLIDAQQIELDPNSVDAVICRFGYMLMADPVAALTETRRVLRPGGRVTLAVWGGPERNPFFGMVVMAMVQAGHMPSPDPDAPGVFSMADEGRVAAALTTAGFERVEVEEVPVRFDVGGSDHYLEVIGDTAGPIALALRGLSDHERGALGDGLAERLSPFATENGHELPGVALCAVAR
jgi:ubiquinone/menaquinone biosynthesis C-methylase UbiE